MGAEPHPLDRAASREVGDTCTCFGLRKAARAVTQLYDEVLRPTGLRTTQFTLLMAIHAAGPIPVTRLADGVVMDRTTMTRNLELLRREGMIRMRPGSDRRVREVALTRRGERAVAEAYPYWQEAQRRMASRFGARRLRRLLGELTGAVDVVRGA